MKLFSLRSSKNLNHPTLLTIVGRKQRKYQHLELRWDVQEIAKEISLIKTIYQIVALF